MKNDAALESSARRPSAGPRELEDNHRASRMSRNRLPLCVR